MNPNATITDVQFQDFLRKVRDLVEGPYTEWQKEIEVTNKFPEKFYQSNIDNDIYRYSLPVEYGGWGLNEKEILQVQEEFSRGPSGMRMHMHYASAVSYTHLDVYKRQILNLLGFRSLIAETLDEGLHMRDLFGLFGSLFPQELQALFALDQVTRIVAGIEGYLP